MNLSLREKHTMNMWVEVEKAWRNAAIITGYCQNDKSEIVQEILTKSIAYELNPSSSNNIGES